MTINMKIDYESNMYSLEKTGLVKGEIKDANKALSTHKTYGDLNKEIKKTFQENLCKESVYSVIMTEEAAEELGWDRVEVLESLIRVQNLLSLIKSNPLLEK